MNGRRDAFAVVATLVWIAGAVVARRYGIWIGIGAAAVALGTAACVAGNDPVKMLRLPFTDDQLIMQP